MYTDTFTKLIHKFHKSREFVLHSRYKDFDPESIRAINDFVNNLRDQDYRIEVCYGHYINVIPSSDDVDEYYAWFKIRLPLIAML